LMQFLTCRALINAMPSTLQCVLLVPNYQSHMKLIWAN
jgi:hypothetical protein